MSMGKKKGMTLPLVIALVVFVMLLGVLVVGLAQSTHKIAYANVQKNQAYYLAKAGTEIAYGYLDSPVDVNLEPGNGQTWFNYSSPVNNTKTIQTVQNELNNITKKNFQKVDVYLDSSNPKANPVFVGSGGAAPANHKLIGEIRVKITVESGDGGALNKNNALFRIQSVAKVLDGLGTINDEYTLYLDVRGANKFDRKYY